MKENAKLYKSQKNRTVHTLSKRLQHEEEKREEGPDDSSSAQKRKKLADGSGMPVS